VYYCAGIGRSVHVQYYMKLKLNINSKKEALHIGSDKYDIGFKYDKS